MSKIFYKTPGEFKFELAAGVLWEKLDMVRDCENMQKFKFLRATQGQEGRMQEGIENLFSYISILPMLWPNLNSSAD